MEEGPIQDAGNLKANLLTYPNTKNRTSTKTSTERKLAKMQLNSDYQPKRKELQQSKLQKLERIGSIPPIQRSISSNSQSLDIALSEYNNLKTNLDPFYHLPDETVEYLQKSQFTIVPRQPRQLKRKQISSSELLTHSNKALMQYISITKESSETEKPWFELNQEVNELKEQVSTLEALEYELKAKIRELENKTVEAHLEELSPRKRIRQANTNTDDLSQEPLQAMELELVKSKLEASEAEKKNEELELELKLVKSKLESSEAEMKKQELELAKCQLVASEAEKQKLELELELKLVKSKLESSEAEMKKQELEHAKCQLVASEADKMELKEEQEQELVRKQLEGDSSSQISSIFPYAQTEFLSVHYVQSQSLFDSCFTHSLASSQSSLSVSQAFESIEVPTVVAEVWDKTKAAVEVEVEVDYELKYNEVKGALYEWKHDWQSISKPVAKQIADIQNSLRILKEFLDEKSYKELGTIFEITIDDDVTKTNEIIIKNLREKAADAFEQYRINFNVEIWKGIHKLIRIRGIVRRGLTCHMIASLQLIFRCKEFVAELFLLYKTKKSDNFVYSLVNIFLWMVDNQEAKGGKIAIWADVLEKLIMMQLKYTNKKYRISHAVDSDSEEKKGLSLRRSSRSSQKKTSHSSQSISSSPSKPKKTLHAFTPEQLDVLKTCLPALDELQKYDVTLVDYIGSTMDMQETFERILFSLAVDCGLDCALLDYFRVYSKHKDASPSFSLHCGGGTFDTSSEYDLLSHDTPISECCSYTGSCVHLDVPCDLTRFEVDTTRLPKFLSMSFERTRMETTVQGHRKNKNESARTQKHFRVLVFPLTLDLECCGLKYTLIGATLHQGKDFSAVGHFVTLLRKADSDGNYRNIDWILNNDDKCFDFCTQPFNSRKKYAGEEFHWQFTEDRSCIRSRDAYMLMYKRIDEAPVEDKVVEKEEGEGEGEEDEEGDEEGEGEGC